jgi:endoglucanase
MDPDLDLDVLKALLAAPGPSSFESRPATVFRERAEALGLATRRDAYGSVFAIAGEGRRPRLLLSGHIDEIGLLVSHVDEHGFAWFKAVGGWDAQQLVGQRVRVVGKGGDVVGLIGRKPVHLMSAEDRRKVAKIEDLWIDIGARDRDEALAHVEPGDVAVIEQPLVELLGGRIAGKALDDRIGAYVALETARRAAEADAACEVVASATVQEEIGGVGASAASFALEPDVAIAIDVTHATDVPGIQARQEGDHALGSGPELSVGSYVHRGVLELLRRTAEEEGIAFTIGTSPRRTATDADQLARARAGVPSAVVSIPNRYMHSPNEMVDPADVAAAVRLLSAFADRLPEAHPVEQP